MYDEEDDDRDSRGLFLWVLGILTTILVVVAIVAISGDDLPAATVTGDPVEETTTSTTTTTEAPDESSSTTTETTTTTIAEPEIAATMWDALNDSGQAGLFASLGAQLGLQDDLEAIEDDNGDPVERTLLAPSDEAIGKLTPETISDIVGDPEQASALIGYHFLDGRYTFDDLQALDGQSIETRTGQLISFANDGDAVVVNGISRISDGDFEAENGIVHVIDTILDPPDNVNELIGLANIEFEVASATITAASEEELQKAVDFFTANPDINASIEGHTDTDGGDEENQQLSQARADAVKAFLVDNGIDEGRLTATGFGESDPILVDGVEDKEASRRIEFIVES